MFNKIGSKDGSSIGSAPTYTETLHPHHSTPQGQMSAHSQYREACASSSDDRVEQNPSDLASPGLSEFSDADFRRSMQNLLSVCFF